MNNKNKILEKKLSDFVMYITDGRDESHGYEHAKCVVENSKKIMFSMEINDNQYKWSLIVAWLHDVADHKYDKDGSLLVQLKNFIKSIESNDDICEKIVICVGLISFSKEIKYGYKYYEKILSGEWLIVRNIVSDADKLEAIGYVGIIRGMQYAQENSKDILSDDQLIKYVWENAKERMFLLSRYYMNTKIGSIMSVPLHIMSVDWFKIKGIKVDELKYYENNYFIEDDSKK